METAEQILELAREIFVQDRAGHRDCLLEVGRLLHEFILAFLRRGEGMHAETARRQGICRKVAITECAKKLGITRLRVHYLINASMAAELLGDSQCLGGIAWSTISDFGKLIERRKDGDCPGPKIGRAGGLPISCREVWRIIPECEAEAKELFARTVRENYPRRRAGAEISKVQDLAPRKEAILAGVKERERKKREAGVGRRNRLPDADRIGLPSSPAPYRHRVSNEDREEESERRDSAQLLASAKVASPGDVADMCIELIEAAEDPRAVVQKLQPLLARVLLKKRPVSFAG